MASPTPFEVALEHLPPGYTVYAALFTDVANAAFLQAQLIARNPLFEYALVDASAVLSQTHVLAAVFKAVWAHHTGALKTPNIHSETVLSLSPSLNIAEAYRRYGISADTRNAVIVKVLVGDDRVTAADVWTHLTTNVESGRPPVALSDTALLASTDLAKVRKYFKLNSVPSLAGNDDTPAKRQEAEVLALGAMALRGL